MLDRVRDEDAWQAYPALMDALSAAVRPLLELPLRQMAATCERMREDADPEGAASLARQWRLIDAARAAQKAARGIGRPADGEGPHLWSTPINPRTGHPGRQRRCSRCRRWETPEVASLPCEPLSLRARAAA